MHRIESEREGGSRAAPRSFPGRMAEAWGSSGGGLGRAAWVSGAMSLKPHSGDEEALCAPEKCRVSNLACLPGPTGPRTGQGPART